MNENPELASKEIFLHHQPEPLMIVISGPSGVGKDSVIQHMQKRDLPFYFVVTATTRAKRPDETHGVDYFFVTHEEFARMISDDELIEYAFVYNDYKGIPKEHIRKALDSGQDVVMRLDVQGAATMRRKFPAAVLIFLATQTEEELVERLSHRKTESEPELMMRIAMARKELARLKEFDYVVYNHPDQIEAAVDIVLAIMEAEHHRVIQKKVCL